MTKTLRLCIFTSDKFKYIVRTSNCTKQHANQASSVVKVSFLIVWQENKFVAISRKMSSTSKVHGQKYMSDPSINMLSLRVPKIDEIVCKENPAEIRVHFPSAILASTFLVDLGHVVTLQLR